MSEGPLIFKDLGKKASDLLTRDFPSDKGERTVEWKGKTDEGVALTTKLVTSKDGSTTGTLAYEYTQVDWAATFKNELSTSRKCIASVEVKNQIADGLKTKLETQGESGSIFGVFDFEFKNDLTAVTGTLNYGKAEGPELTGGVVVGASGFSLGANAEYRPNAGSGAALRTIQARLAYGASDFDANAWGTLDNSGDAEKQLVGVSYFHKVSGEWQVGSQVSFDLASTEAKPELKIGTQWAQNADSTWKVRFDTAGQLALSLRQKYSEHVSFTLGSSFDTTDLASKASNKFGFSLNIKD